MTLSRKKYRMPDFVKRALMESKVMKDYESRPAYQRNDYISWILQAKQETTKQKRLKQMLSELKRGGVYMKMKHHASIKN